MLHCYCFSSTSLGLWPIRSFKFRLFFLCCNARRRSSFPLPSPTLPVSSSSAANILSLSDFPIISVTSRRSLGRSEYRGFGRFASEAKGLSLNEGRSTSIAVLSLSSSFSSPSSSSSASCFCSSFSCSCWSERFCPIRILRT